MNNRFGRSENIHMNETTDKEMFASLTKKTQSMVSFGRQQNQARKKIYSVFSTFYKYSSEDYNQYRTLATSVKCY